MSMSPVKSRVANPVDGAGVEQVVATAGCCWWLGRADS